MRLNEHLADLITNSVEAVAKHVLVMLSSEEGGVSLTVSDDGCGITDEQAAKAFCGSDAPRGNGLRLIKEDAERSGGYMDVHGDCRGTVVKAVFKGKTDTDGVGDAIIAFWQEYPIMGFTLSVVTDRGGYCFDSRLIEAKYGSFNDMETMVKVREDINLNVSKLFGGK